MQANAQEELFLAALIKPLPQPEQIGIRNEITAYLPEEGETFADALFSALATLNLNEYWLQLQLDIKGIEEVEWQANALARTHGINDRFTLDGDEETLNEALQAFNDWLSIKQFALLQHAELSDTYHGFICRKNQSKRLIKLAGDANIALAALPARPKITREFLFSRKKHTQGTLGEIIAEAHEKSLKKGYRTLLYLAIPDCEPCMAFERMLDQPLVNRALKHTNILRLDTMLFGNQLKAYGINCNVVPTFIGITPNGCVSQNISKTEDLWREISPRQIAAFFQRFLAAPENQETLVLDPAQQHEAFSAAIACSDQSRAFNLYDRGNLNCDDLIRAGYLILHHAKGTTQPQLLEFLLERCTLLDVQNGQAQTALNAAIRSFDGTKALRLVQQGADTSIADNSGRTPLLNACISPHLHTPELLSYLTKQESDCNTQDRQGLTPLHLSATHDLELSSMLLKQGAEPNRQDMEGDTPLHRAAAVRNQGQARQMLALMEKYGGNLDSQNAKGESPRQIFMAKHGCPYEQFSG